MALRMPQVRRASALAGLKAGVQPFAEALQQVCEVFRRRAPVAAHAHMLPRRAQLPWRYSGIQGQAPQQSFVGAEYVRYAEAVAPVALLGRGQLCQRRGDVGHFLTVMLLRLWQQELVLQLRPHLVFAQRVAFDGRARVNGPDQRDQL